MEPQLARMDIDLTKSLPSPGILACVFACLPHFTDGARPYAHMSSGRDGRSLRINPLVPAPRRNPVSKDEDGTRKDVRAYAVRPRSGAYRTVPRLLLGTEI